MNKATMRPTLILPALMVMIAGCSDSERVAELATEAADRQAQQNQEMARLNREVAAGTRRLVEADAEARREIAASHKDLQSERGELSQQWNALETERREIAEQRRTESMLAPVAKAIGAALLAALVVGFCWSLLFGLQRHDQADMQLAELLVQEIVSEQPVLLPTRFVRPAITDSQAPAGDDTHLISDSSSDT